MGPQEVAPAFYARRNDWWTLLHPPYTAWHLSYVAVGAALAPHFHLDRMLWALASFFLAMGVAAHALDELHGRPLRTRIPSSVLITVAAASLAGAVAIGVYAAIAWGYGLLAFVAAGAILVPAYNLELAFHTDAGFALAWGAFPALTGYFVEAQAIRVEALAAAAYAFLLSLAQRALSTPARKARREERRTEPALERALLLLAAAAVALAVALVAARLR